MGRGLGGKVIQSGLRGAGAGRGRGRGGRGGGGRGMGDGRPPKPAFMKEGDWQCPNTDCNNVNFSWRGECNRCQTARPGGAMGRGRGEHTLCALAMML